VNPVRQYLLFVFVWLATIPAIAQLVVGQQPQRQQTPTQQTDAQRAQQYWQLGCEEHDRGELARALKTLRKAESAAQQAREWPLFAKIEYRLARILTDQNESVLAIEQCHRNLVTFARLHDEWNTGATYMLMHYIYKQLGDIRSANHYKTRYYQLAARSKDPIQNSVAAHHRGQDYQDNKEYSKALASYWKAVSFTKQLPKDLEKKYAFPVLHDITVLYSHLGQRSAATRTLRQAIDLLQDGQPYADEIQRYLLLAGISDETGQQAETARLLKKAIKLARKSGRLSQLQIALDDLARLEEQDGNYRAALIHHKEARLLADSLTSISRAKTIASIEANYRVKQQEQAIRQLQQDSVLQHVNSLLTHRELATVNQQRWWLSGGMIGLLGVLGLIFVLFARTRRLQQQTEQQRQLLESQTAELQASNQTKDKLFSIVGHDLRSPVMGLQSLVQTLRQNQQEPELLPPLLLRAEDQVNQLGRLTNNLLYWALTQQGLLQDRLVWVDLAELVAECETLFRDSMQRKGLRVVLTAQANPIWADENQTMIVVRNLFDNAVKFSPSDSPIEVRLGTTETGTTLLIRNQIMAESGKVGGANLGLRLIEGLVERQNGSVHVTRPDESSWQVSVSWPQSVSHPHLA
jgi:signal transduction histidine kinase